MDTDITVVCPVKTEIKSEENDEPEEFPHFQVKEEGSANYVGELIQYPSESMILYETEHLKFEETDLKSEISEIYNYPNNLSDVDWTSGTGTNEHSKNYDEDKGEISGYQTHDKRHHQEKMSQHECNQCDFKTSQSSSLKRHLHLHRKSDKVKLYMYKPSIENVECPNCDYQTNDRSNLRRHIIHHCVLSCSNSKTYICYHCGHKASQKLNLQVHIFRKHRPKEEIKYHCEECSYQPVSKSDLEIHKLVHKNAKHMKVYKCLYCKYQTIYKVSLDRHMATHKRAHEIDMYQCYLCKYKAVRKDELRNHILRHAKKSLKKSKR